MFERAVRSSANLGRLWNAYGAYNPYRVTQMLDIFRVVHNYVLVSKDDRFARVPLLFEPEHVADPSGLVSRIRQKPDALSQFIWKKLSPQTKKLVGDPHSDEEHKQLALLDDLNAIIHSGQSIHETRRFSTVKLSSETSELLGKSPQGEALVKLNRFLIEDAFPNFLVKIRMGTTPAMRLGTAKAPSSYYDILYFKG